LAISILLYSGLALLALGSISLVRPPSFLGISTRLHALAVFGSGLAAAAVALLLPSSPARASARGPTGLDRFVPEFQFGEFHERTVRATPERIDDAIRTVPAEEIRLFRVLTWIRNPRRPWRREPENILNPPSKVPILDVATRSGFVILSDEPGREIVLGTLVMRPRGAHLDVAEDRSETARRFAALTTPGYAKAAMSFRVEPGPGGSCRLTTETRIFATDPASARRFATYWRFILPGSSLLRVTWLNAIARRAEIGANSEYSILRP
jgi:hypothetical protein